MDVYSTCPRSSDGDADAFRRRLADVLVWTGAAGCRGILIFDDNLTVDPWVPAQHVVQHTEALVPLVVVRPHAMPPFAVARKVNAFAHLFGRGVDLALATGAGERERRAAGDPADRYDRLVEYGTVLGRLFVESAEVTVRGRHHHLDGARLRPPLPTALAPRTFVAGSSAGAVAAARQLGVARLAPPPPPDHVDEPSALKNTGIRVGLLARDTAAEAWRVATTRFPGEPAPTPRTSPYWTYPARAHREFCPYLVGSHAEVADALARYFSLGIGPLIVHEPLTEDDLHHAFVAVRAAERLVPSDGGLDGGRWLR